jgi:oxygen-independent coproporphyrinogen-3 oxidase
VPVGLDHFSLPDDRLAQAARGGELRRNFQGYVTDQATALIGIGASAISSLPQGYSQNQPKVPDYRRAIEGGDFATVRGVTLTEEDRVRRDIIERLMCDLSIDLAEVSDRWRVSPRAFDLAVAALAPMVEDGLVSLSGSRIEVHVDARSVVRSVCSAFDSYLDSSAIRHAAGI